MREVDLAIRENAARARVLQLERESIAILNEKKIQLQKDSYLHSYSMKLNFTRARIALDSLLHSQKALLKERFGTLRSNEQSAARRYSVMWSKVPQPIEIRVHLLKCVSSKLRRGNFVVLATMYDRLGGSIMGWSKVSEPAKRAVSEALTCRWRVLDRP